MGRAENCHVLHRADAKKAIEAPMSWAEAKTYSRRVGRHFHVRDEDVSDAGQSRRQVCHAGQLLTDWKNEKNYVEAIMDHVRDGSNEEQNLEVDIIQAGLVKESAWQRPGKSSGKV